MANRTGTYIAFAAEGGKNVTETDFKYYNLLKGWNKMKNREFNIVNSHEKIRQIRGWSSEPTIVKTLKERMKASKRFMLLVGDKTRLDDDYIPFEIEYAVKECGLPVIICFVNERNRLTTKTYRSELDKLIPQSLKDLMKNNEVKTIHIPFRERIMSKALDDFDFNNMPKHSNGLYNDIVYDSIYDKVEI